MMHLWGEPLSLNSEDESFRLSLKWRLREKEKGRKSVWEREKIMEINNYDEKLKRENEKVTQRW